MMVLHSAEHEDVLHDLVTGDMAPEDPRAKEVLTACHECRRKLEDLRALAALLEETAREERELLLSLDRTSSPPGADRVAPFVRTRAAEARAEQAQRSQPQTPSRRLWPTALKLVAAAAAVVVLAWLARTVLPEPGSPEGVRLGDSQPPDMHPQGRVAAFDHFQWSFALPPGGWYQLVVRPGEPGDPAPLHETSHLTDKAWTPSAEIRASWPDTIRWQVIVRDATGSSIGIHEASAQRSSP